jgi:hypothetical protein
LADSAQANGDAATDGPGGLTLALLMPRVAAHDEYHAASAHDLAAFTDALNAGADLHGHIPF